MKFLFGLVGVAIFYAIWHVRQAQAKSRLREIDEGRRCISCDGTDLAHADGNVQCRQCGYTASLAGLQAAELSASDIAAVTSPDESDRF